MANIVLNNIPNIYACLDGTLRCDTVKGGNNEYYLVLEGFMAPARGKDDYDKAGEVKGLKIPLSPEQYDFLRREFRHTATMTGSKETRVVVEGLLEVKVFPEIDNKI